MKYLRIIFIIAVVIIAAAVYYLYPKHQQKHITLPVPIKHISSTSTIIPIHSVSKTLFVPYWTLSKQHIDDSSYSTLVYFGIAVNANGIDTNEQGYQSIDQFLAVTNPSKKRLLAVRMINSDINTQILNDKNLQRTIIPQSIQIAKQKSFEGIVVDFEISALGFENITKEISDFEVTFGKSVKQEHLQFYATAYGDTFFRGRPFDITAIAKAADGIMIMAYDLHKANGDPGSNFGLHADADDYDLTQMVEQFGQSMPLRKATVILGMYGYDWQIDDQGRSIKPGIAISDSDIQQKFVDSCTFKDCKITRDHASAETNITYIDRDNNNHSIWFEDSSSAAKKTEYLMSHGISSIGYWAYSYF